MKNLFRVPFTMLLVSLIFVACSKEEESTTEIINSQESIGNVTMTETDNNQIIIESFDFAVRKSIDNPELTDEEIGAIFIDRAHSLGLEGVEEKNYDYSEEFLNYSEIFQRTERYESSTGYLNTINGLREEINRNELLSDYERTKLNNGITFMNSFVGWQISISDDFGEDKNQTEGWWDDWGRCAAGTLGGAITGAGTLGIAGAAVGTVVPVLGNISLGTVGLVVGGVGGALTGAATFC